jgi:hypothetical protein
MGWFTAPVRGSGNPILVNGPEQRDDIKTGPCAVKKMGPNDYRMWYEGIDSSLDPDGGGPNLYNAACYATSVDGKAWTKVSRVLTPDGSATWENDELCPTSIVWDGTQWVMFYHGGNNSGTRKIGRATSATLDSGGSWTKYGSNPILSNGTAGQWDEGFIADCKVIMVSPTDWRMWYVGRNASLLGQVGYATSTDGISWTKSGSNPVLAFGAASAWDDYDIMAFCPVRLDDGSFHAWYIARPDAGTVPSMGQAISADGIAWTRVVGNPTLVGGTGPDVSDSVDVLIDSGEPRPLARLYYGYYDFTGSPIRGKAYAESEGISVPEAPLLDDFNRASLGSTWSAGGLFTTSGTLETITSTSITRAAAGGYRQAGYYNVATFPQDQAIIGEVSGIPTVDFEGFTFCGRVQSPGTAGADGYILAVVKNGSNYDWAFTRVTNLAGTSIGTTTTTTPLLAVGDLIAFTLTGSVLRGWLKPVAGPWRVMVTTTDTTYVVGGAVALEFTNDQVPRLTNLWAGSVDSSPFRPDRMPQGV